ncbi:MAG: hypothetical protein QXN56_06970 [Candidatus Hadarchaeum sp.]
MRFIRDALSAEELELLNETIIAPEVVFLRVSPPVLPEDDIMEDVPFFVTSFFVVAGYALMLFLLCA